MSTTSRTPGSSAPEKRVVIHSARVYGSARPIERIAIDGVGLLSGYVEGNYTTLYAYAELRAILADFDVTTITWKWAYTDGNLTLGTDVARQLNIYGQGNISAHGWPLISFGDGATSPIDAWNEEVAIYGWEVRLAPASAPGATDVIRAQWTGSAEPVIGYAILAG